MATAIAERPRLCHSSTVHCIVVLPKPYWSDHSLILFWFWIFYPLIYILNVFTPLTWPFFNPLVSLVSNETDTDTLSLKNFNFVEVIHWKILAWIRDSWLWEIVGKNVKTSRSYLRPVRNSISGFGRFRIWCYGHTIR